MPNIKKYQATTSPLSKAPYIPKGLEAEATKHPELFEPITQARPDGTHRMVYTGKTLGGNFEENSKPNGPKTGKAALIMTETIVGSTFDLEL